MIWLRASPGRRGIAHPAVRRLGIRWLLVAVPMLAGMATLTSTAQAFRTPPCFNVTSANPDSQCVRPVGIGNESIGTVELNGVRMRVCDGDGSNRDLSAVYYCLPFLKDGRASLFDLTLSAQGWPNDMFPGYGNVSLFYPAPLHHLVVHDGQDVNDAITGLALTVDPASGGFAATTDDPYSRTDIAPMMTWLTGDGNVAVMHTQDCPPPPAPHSGGPGGVANPLGFDYALNSHQNYTGGLTDLKVTYNYGQHLSTCFLDEFPNRRAPDARVAPPAQAADACTPPSHTRITQAKFTARTAFFRFTARHAQSFHCELSRNGRAMFYHSCKSPKPYAGPLPKGKYTFEVAGVGTGGVDHKAAVKKFEVR